jgi:hypothetical protein
MFVQGVRSIETRRMPHFSPAMRSQHPAQIRKKSCHLHSSLTILNENLTQAVAAAFRASKMLCLFF